MSLTNYLSLSPQTEQDHPGPADVQRGSFPPVSGGASGEHHQRRRPHGRLVLHARRPPRAHRGRVQRSETGPARPAERVHEQREYPPGGFPVARPENGLTHTHTLTHTDTHTHTLTHTHTAFHFLCTTSPPSLFLCHCFIRPRFLLHYNLPTTPLLSHVRTA